jgi:hypothetical protein
MDWIKSIIKGSSWLLLVLLIINGAKFYQLNFTPKGLQRIEAETEHETHLYHMCLANRNRLHSRKRIKDCDEAAKWHERAPWANSIRIILEENLDMFQDLLGFCPADSACRYHWIRTIDGLSSSFVTAVGYCVFSCAAYVWSIYILLPWKDLCFDVCLRRNHHQQQPRNSQTKTKPRKPKPQKTSKSSVPVDTQQQQPQKTSQPPPYVWNNNNNHNLPPLPMSWPSASNCVPYFVSTVPSTTDSILVAESPREQQQQQPAREDNHSQQKNTSQQLSQSTAVTHNHHYQQEQSVVQYNPPLSRVLMRSVANPRHVRRLEAIDRV